MAEGSFVEGGIMNFQLLNYRLGWVDVIKVLDDGDRVILRKTFDDSNADQVNCSKAFFEREIERGRIRRT